MAARQAASQASASKLLHHQVIQQAPHQPAMAALQEVIRLGLEVFNKRARAHHHLSAEDQLIALGEQQTQPWLPVLAQLMRHSDLAQPPIVMSLEQAPALKLEMAAEAVLATLVLALVPTVQPQEERQVLHLHREEQSIQE